jgi:hypothetical protein
MYAELPPPPELRSTVRCLWVREVEEPETVDVLPDGCVDLVVRGEHAQVAGPDTVAAPTRCEPGELIVGVRFHPGAAGAALGIPTDELRDGRTPLADVWGAFAAEVAERGSGDPYGLAAALAPRLVAVVPDSAALAAAVRLERDPATPVAQLGALSERQLRRRFGAAVGYGPKTFARVMRFRRMLALVRSGEPLAWAAAAAGYADQPHMTREASELAGRPPTALR